MDLEQERQVEPIEAMEIANEFHVPYLEIRSSLEEYSYFSLGN